MIKECLKSRFMEGCEPFIEIGENGIGVIFQHGATGTPASMKWAAKYFQGRGYTVMVPALAGHATTVEDVARKTADDYRTSLETAICYLRGCCDKVYLCGLSMGCMISLIVGSYMKIDGLVLMAGPAWGCGLDMKNATSPGNAPEQGGWYRPELKQNWKTYDAARMFALSRQSMQELYALEERAAAQATLPVCLIYSNNDKTVPIEHGKFLFDALRTEQKELHILEHSGHVLTADGERDTVFRIIDKFIQNTIEGIA